MKYKNLIFISIVSIFTFWGTSLSASEYSFLTVKNSLYILKISDTKKYNIQSYISEKLETVEDIAKKTNAFAVINGGFFDPKNMKTVSYIIEDGQIAANPTLNEKLTESIALKPYLEKIYNRAEFRVYNCFGKTTFDITKHNDKTAFGCKIVHSIQAGPQLLPEMNLEDEFFILKQNGKVIKQSAGVLVKTARAAIGIKKDQLYIMVTKEDAKLDIYELQSLIKTLKLDKAMAFDGGSSVSFYLNDCGKKRYVTGLSDSGLRQIKSALVITSK
jgi:exopolysaccharide biosynthesis protein